MIATSTLEGEVVKGRPKKKTPVRSLWTKDDIRQLKAHSKTRTPVVEVAKAMKRTEAAVRQEAKTIELVSVIAVEDCHLMSPKAAGR
jgi:hypothetical protein